MVARRRRRGRRRSCIDSREVRARFGLGEFAGQLFIHVAGAAGHDVVKYALDTFGDGDGRRTLLSCTHDANAWPADRYAGLPAPAPGERVHAVGAEQPRRADPGRRDRAQRDGRRAGRARSTEPIGAVRDAAPSMSPSCCRGSPGRRRSSCAPASTWCARATRSSTAGRRRIAHVNVERTDLKPDPSCRGLGELLGKGYLLPAPILPRGEWQSLAVADADGGSARANCRSPRSSTTRTATRSPAHRFGRLPRDASRPRSTSTRVAGRRSATGYGHVELVYDFAEGGDGDGWLHALFRYRHRAQRPCRRDQLRRACLQHDPHLSRRAAILFRPPAGPVDAAVPAARRGRLRHAVPPDLSGLAAVAADERDRDHPARRARQRGRAHGAWRSRARARGCGAITRLFDEATRARAGAGAYAVIRDTTCRLFGYHGLVGRGGAFSLDHMFGF